MGPLPSRQQPAEELRDRLSSSWHAGHQWAPAPPEQHCQQRTSAARLAAASGARSRTYVQYTRMSTSSVTSCHRPPWPWLTLNTAASCAKATILASCRVTPRVCRGRLRGGPGVGVGGGGGGGWARCRRRTAGTCAPIVLGSRGASWLPVQRLRSAAQARPKEPRPARLPARPRAPGPPEWWPAAPFRHGQTCRLPGQTQRCLAATPPRGPVPSQTAHRSGRQSCSGGGGGSGAGGNVAGWVGGERGVANGLQRNPCNVLGWQTHEPTQLATHVAPPPPRAPTDSSRTSASGTVPPHLV